MTQSTDTDKGALRTDQNDLINQKGFSFSGYERDGLFLNLGGTKYRDISGVSGIDSITDGRAGVFADFDNDGDYDVFSTTIQGESHLLFRNNVGQDRHWLRIALAGGPATGRDAFGAVVRVRTSAGLLTKIKSGGSGFISEHDPRLLFGLGPDERAQALEVTWPNGTTEAFTGAMNAGTSLLLSEGTGRAEVVESTAARLPDPLSRAEAIAGGLKIAVGRELPNLALKTTAGTNTSLREHVKPGRRLLINVWATWCAPCAVEMVELQRLSPQLAARGIDLIGLNVDTEPDANVADFLAAKGVTYPILVGGVTSIEGLYATDEMAVPLSILVNDRGVVTELIPGWSSATQRRFADLARPRGKR